MKTRINESLTSDLVVRYYRNLASPQSVLGRRLSRPLAKRLQEHKARKKGKTYGEGFFRDRIELSSPGADKAILWIDEEPFDYDHTDTHTGWYCDPWCEETMNGGAIMLPDFPNVYFESYIQSACDGQPVFLESFQAAVFTDCEDGYDADHARKEVGEEVAQWANETARIAAEDEKEYQVKDRAEYDAAEKLEERRALATEFRELVAEARGQLFPTLICETIKARLSAIVEEREELFQEAQSLREDPWQIAM